MATGSTWPEGESRPGRSGLTALIRGHARPPPDRAAPLPRITPSAAEAGIALGGWLYLPAMCYHVHVENRIASLVVDATDAELLAQFWAGALGWQVVNRG